MNIEQIALEVAQSETGGTESFVFIGQSELIAFSKAFLARVDAERGESGVVAWYVCYPGQDPFLVCDKHDLEHHTGYYTPAYFSPTLPEGWKAVPAVATLEMCKAGWDGYDSTPQSVRHIYNTMIAAAPEVPE